MNGQSTAAGVAGRGVLLQGRVLLLMGALVLGGCITINIYFPAAAAEKAADRIIDDVLGKGGTGEAPPAAPPAAK